MVDEITQVTISTRPPIKTLVLFIHLFVHLRSLVEVEHHSLYYNNYEPTVTVGGSGARVT